MKYYLYTYGFLSSFLEKDLEGLEFVKLNSNWFEVSSLKSLKLRFVERIYVESSNGYYFDELGLKLEDVLSFSLFERSFIHRKYNVPSYIVSYIMFYLNLNDSDSVIDPLAGFGEILLEVGFHMANIIPKKNELFSNIPSKQKLPLTGVVEDNSELKRCKENSQFFRLKPKFSILTFDWLDVKFHGNDFKALITYTGDFEELKDLFYQGEFISEKIAIISDNIIDSKFYDEYVDCVHMKKLDGYYIYFFKSSS